MTGKLSRRSAIALVAFAAGCPARAVPATAARTIRIATEGAYPPFNYVENDQPAGFEVDLGRALCAAMGATCTFVLQDWEGMIPALKAGTFDAIMSSMEITPSRRHKIAFSEPYYQIPSALLARKTSPKIEAATSELDGKTIGTTANSEFMSYLEDSYKNVRIKTYDNLEEASLDLLTGRIDYVLGDKLELSKFLAQREGEACCHFVANMPVERGEGIGVGLRKGDAELLASFNQAIDRTIADGTYEGIRKKYFPFPIR